MPFSYIKIYRNKKSSQFNILVFMKRHILTAPEWADYLSNFMTEIPPNCIFDKGRTGCGGTELALTNGKHTIIVMPYVNLVVNKVQQHGGKVLGVYQGIHDEDIENYINTHELWKITCTYDALPRVISTIQNMGIDAYNDFFLLVDEWHVLFNNYVFRNKAVTEVLNIAPSFEEVTYMTATPIEDEYIFKEIKDLPVFEVKWPNITEIKVREVPTNRCLQCIGNVIQQHLEGKAFGNLHIFVNSVYFISKVIRRYKLSPDDVKVVCALSLENQTKIGKPYPIGKPLDPVKKVNFYTSTCFEGCDIYDEDGKTYVVSDGNRQNSLLDISTLFIQICGRIRNSKYNKDGITYIFSPTRYDGGVTLDEFKKMCTDEYVKSNKWIEDINALNEDARAITLEGLPENFLNERYVHLKDNHLEIDKNMMNLDILNFKIRNKIYQSRLALKVELMDNGFNVVSNRWDYYSDKLAADKEARIPFKELCLEYDRLAKSNNFGNNVERLNLIAQEKPVIREAYQKLGIEKMVELKFNQTNIIRNIIKQSDIPQRKKIKEMILNKIGVFTPIELRNAKKIIAEIYSFLGLSKTAKATDLKDYFLCKKSTRKYNGRSVKCIEIINEKIIG